MEKVAEDKLRRNFAFDQYGRYAIVRDIINANRKDNEIFKVLDVGGRGNILRQFLAKDKVFYLDPYVETKDDNYIKGNGCAMPLKAESFDWVVSADVFEHIPKKDRSSFLSENLRVAKKGVVLVAPFYSKEVQEAEISANENYKTLAGEEHIWLKEHIDNGLPKEKEIEDSLLLKKYQYQKINNNMLLLWEHLTNVGFMVAHNYSTDIKKKFEDINSFYNMNIAPLDHEEGSYRKVYFIKKDKNLKSIILKKNKDLLNIFLPEILRKSASITNKINKNMRQHINNTVQDTKKVEASNKILLDTTEGKVAEVKRLEKEILVMQNSKFWKLRNVYVRFGPRRIARIPRRVIRVLRRDGIRMFIKKIGYLVYFKGHIPQQYPEYQRWIKSNERITAKEAKTEIEGFKYKPKISVIVPVYNVEPKWLNKCINSVRGQYYENWELCLYDDASTQKETIECLKGWQKKGDSRIKTSLGKKNQHISGASNEALKMATGEFIALLDNDDELAPFALLENVKLLNEHKDADFIYSDEDKMNRQGKRSDPFFKPVWSPELMLSQMYTCHLGVYRKSIIDKIGGFRKGYEGAQDYDLVLRFIEKTRPENIYHIPKVLYHWRTLETSTAMGASAKDYAHGAAKKALQDYLARNSLLGEVLDGKAAGSHRVRLEIKGKPLVSIIIPFRDHVEVLKTCVDSIIEKTDYDNYEIILVDNQSEKQKTKEYLRELKSNPRIKVLEYNKPFCYSAINNYAVSKSEGEYVLLLNNDTEVITREWLRAMLEQAQKEGVGVVGAKLLYHDDRIQHAGVIMGTGIAGHAFKGFLDGQPNYFRHADIIKNYSAVTAACLMTKKSIFEQLGGLNEKDLKVAYNDVDFCLRVVEAGYRVVYTPYAKLYHHESLSRGYDHEFEKTNPEEYKRVVKEWDYMNKKWKKYIANDQYYSPNLTRKHENFSINTDFSK